MDENIRRVVAYVAAGRITGEFCNSIYSYEHGSRTSMSESYDYEAHAHFNGARSGNIYHYGLGVHISLKENGQKFSGYDYGSGSHFSGSISLKTVQLFDYGTNQYFTYSV